MGSSGRPISQEAFDALVAENVSDLFMDPEEALEDAVQTLTLQGVNLSGIVKCVPGVNRVEDNPVMRSLGGLKKMSGRLECSVLESSDIDEMVEYFDEICSSCSSGGDNASILMKNGGIEFLVSFCGACHDGSDRVLISALRALSSVLRDFQSREAFGRGDGPKITMDILRSSDDPNLLDCGFSVVVAAATGNEIVKEAFVELKIEELFLEILRGQPTGAVPNLYDAIRVLLTPDDNRVAASQVYGYARRFAKIGIADALLDAFHEGIGSPGLLSACIALKAIAVNDEICRSISSKGGIDVILQCIDDSSVYNNKAVAKACCSLLSKEAMQTRMLLSRGTVWIG
ncbi:Cytochrome c-like domain-containing protein [Dioscorea alata]|uniref:Cytochrome c-like domain-containing protein n=1 Tax=Dioscorea alata TaxID=55571 RepID=A0ACB7VY10_DIOAL|nr:Cytochrome c-like domain-containing protein [Dioscorea alata]